MSTNLVYSRKAYRRAYYLKNKARENALNRERYHATKSDPDKKKRRQEAWRAYAKAKGKHWASERSKRYRKAYKDLSDKQKESIRKCCREWTAKNWSKRVEYARQFRRRNPLFGFRAALGLARDTGDFSKLSEICERAAVSINE